MGMTGIIFEDWENIITLQVYWIPLDVLEAPGFHRGTVRIFLAGEKCSKISKFTHLKSLP
jgi:hypothetical protein